jgi:hypothetical protein
MDAELISQIYSEQFGADGDGQCRDAVEHVMSVVAAEAAEAAVKDHLCRDRQQLYQRSLRGALVHVAVPYLYTMEGAAVDSWNIACDPRGPNRRQIFQAHGAFLARNFNVCWCRMLNDRKLGFTHFCMIHTDVCPHTPWWLDALVAEQERTGADLLSVVLPIKTYHGLTSTALENIDNGVVRRMTMQEVCAVPALTFDAASAGFPGWRLLASTGLWIVDLRKPWFDELYPSEYDPKRSWKDYPCFEVRDRIFQLPDASWVYETKPEDWHFSRLLHQLGRKIMATRAVTCGHMGQLEYANNKPWGTIARDTDMPGFRWAD